ncbi:hypothetical protein LJ737_06135 [Hymenobacter sp. 15J16-1T3B]|nr:hypothetical protein [Hymenobacter sp. 15J16-1T3B]
MLTIPSYASATAQSGGLGSLTTYRLGNATPQVGAAAGITLALPVPPTGQRTFVLLRAGAAYLRRQANVTVNPGAPRGYPREPEYQLQQRFRTVNVRLLLGLRYWLDEHLVLEAGPMVSVNMQDHSRIRKSYLAHPDSSFNDTSVGLGVANLLLHAGLGYRAASARHPWVIMASYAQGLARDQTLGLGESYAEVTLHYPLRQAR